MWKHSTNFSCHFSITFSSVNFLFTKKKKATEDMQKQWIVAPFHAAWRQQSCLHHMERTKESTAHSGCAFVHVGPTGWLRAVSSSSSLLPSLGPVTASRYCYYQERLLSLFWEYVFAAFIIFTDVVSATAMAPDPYIKRDKSNKSLLILRSLPWAGRWTPVWSAPC